MKKRRPLAFSLLVLGGLGQRRRAACLRVVHAGWRQDEDRARMWSRGCYSVDTTSHGDALTAVVVCCGLEARASMAILGGGCWRGAGIAAANWRSSAPVCQLGAHHGMAAGVVAWSWPQRGSPMAWRQGKAGPCQAMAVASVGASAVC